MKSKIFELLNSLNINYKNYEHIAVFTCNEARDIEIPGKRLKSLLIRNEKKTNYYMVVLEDYKRIDLKKLSLLLNESKFSFASEEKMIEKIGVKPGHVSPFALINNSEKDIKVIFDTDLKDDYIGFHPLQNDNTIVLNMFDVEIFLKSLNFNFLFIDL